MAANIEGNIFTISVPLPGNPLRNLNSYVIRSEGRGRNLLIDTGFRMQPCREALIGGSASWALTCVTRTSSSPTSTPTTPAWPWSWPARTPKCISAAGTAKC